MTSSRACEQTTSSSKLGTENPDDFLIDVHGTDKIVDAQSPTAAYRASASQSGFVDEQEEDELDDSLTSLNWLHSMQGGFQLDQTSEVKKDGSCEDKKELSEDRTSTAVKQVHSPPTANCTKLTIPMKSIAKTATRAPPNRNKNLINVAAALNNAQNFVTISPTKNIKQSSKIVSINDNAVTSRPLSQKTMSKKISITTIPAKREVTTIVNGNLGLTANMGLNRTVGLANRNGASSGTFVPAVLSRAGSTEQGSDFIPYPMNNTGNHHLLLNSTLQNFSSQLSTNAKGSDAAQLLDDPDVSKYKYNHLIKPPFSYTTLICMAMKARGASIDGKITLNHLLSWIADNFSYYKHSDPAWQNNVYHALTSNKCFQKVATGSQSSGVFGSFQEELSSGNSIWRISPTHQHEVDSMFKKKRALQQPTSAHNGNLKKPRFAPNGMIDAHSIIQIGANTNASTNNGNNSSNNISSQSAPARSKRKQFVQEQHSGMARRSNSSGPPMMSMNHHQSPTMVSVQNYSNQGSTSVQNTPQSNRRFVTKQLLNNGVVVNNGTGGITNVHMSNINNQTMMNGINGTGMVQHQMSQQQTQQQFHHHQNQQHQLHPQQQQQQLIVHTTQQQQKQSQQKQQTLQHNSARNQQDKQPKQQSPSKLHQKSLHNQTLNTKSSLSAQDSVNQTVLALNEYVQGLQNKSGSNQVAESANKPISMKQENPENYVPICAQNFPYNSPNQNSQGDMSNGSSCSLPPLLNGPLPNYPQTLKQGDSMLSTFNMPDSSMENNPLNFQQQEETLVTEQDCLLMNLTEDDILSQIDDLFFDISPPQSNNLTDNTDFDALNGFLFDNNNQDNNPVTCQQKQQQNLQQQQQQIRRQQLQMQQHQENQFYQQQQQQQQSQPQQQFTMAQADYCFNGSPATEQHNQSYRNLAVRGSKIEPPLNWSPSPRNLLLQEVPRSVVKTEPNDLDLSASNNSSWMQCSQTSLSLSNNSDWLRDSHERIMKGGQLSEEELELSGHGLANRAVVFQGNPARFLNQMGGVNNEMGQQHHVQIFQQEKMSPMQPLQLNESLMSQESFPQYINSSNEFSSPRMLDLSCLPEPLA